MPAALRERVESLILGEPLVAVAQLDANRRERDLTRADVTVVVLCEDTVKAGCAGETTRWATIGRRRARKVSRRCLRTLAGGRWYGWGTPARGLSTADDIRGITGSSHSRV